LTEKTLAIDRNNDKNKQPVSHNILIVDDEKSVLKAIKRIFIDDNYKIFTALNTTEAIDVVDDNRIQLIISDYSMPGMSGIDLLKITTVQQTGTSSLAPGP